MKALVSGAAGDIGYGIGRILQDSLDVDTVLGSDIHHNFYGLDIFDEIFVMPYVSSPDYIDSLNGIIHTMSIDVFIPTSEPELRYFSKEPTCVEKIDACVIMASGLAMEIGFDKLKTVQFLASIGMKTPWTYLFGECDNGIPELPCILKSRDGSGSSTVFYVDNPSHIKPYQSIYPHFIWQEYLPASLGEYTCGVYRCFDKSTRVIVMRRRLASGVTVFAEVVQNDEIITHCTTIADALDLHGSINIQLRLIEGRGPVVFEINPRFSSTIGMRQRAGFEDVIWSIQEKFYGKRASQYAISFEALTFYRRYVETML